VGREKEKFLWFGRLRITQLGSGRSRNRSKDNGCYRFCSTTEQL